jgi:hypothetical protein
MPASTPADRVALLFSGGSDSTLAAVRAAERFGEVHLLTYRRFGMADVQNSEVHVGKLRERFGADRFVRPPIASVDRLFRHVAHERQWRDVRRHGFLPLTTCGLCKLSFHLRTVVYCHDAGVGNVWDGSNKAMVIFPEQMIEVLDMFRAMYRDAGITYENPVFHYDDDQGIEFGSSVWGLGPARAGRREAARRTTGDELFELGILPERNVKGTPYDKRIQGRCYQMVLFNLWARWYYLERHDMAEYRRDVVAYYTEKVDRARDLVREFLADPAGSRLRRLVEAG